VAEPEFSNRCWAYMSAIDCVPGNPSASRYATTAYSTIPTRT
jgi:hypothetical protein